MFFRSAQEITTTDRIGFSASYTNSSTVGATELRNPNTKAGFYITRHVDSGSKDTVDFSLNVSTKSGNFTIPQFAPSIRLAGRESKIIVTDFKFGENTLLYSTAEVLAHSIVDGKSILALWVPDGESGEFSILGGSKKRQVISGTGGGFHVVGDNLVVNFKGQKTGPNVLEFDNFRVLLFSRSLAYKLWAPTLSNNPLVHADKVAIVTGPYLVRHIAYEGTKAVVTGDIDAAATLEIYAPSAVTSVSWNGRDVASQRTSYGTLKVQLAKPNVDAKSFESSLSLSNWKYSDALPEAASEYDDSSDAWVAADHQTTPNPNKPFTLPVLYADDYGFHNGIQIFRGRFTGAASAVNLTVQGGTAFGFSAWLNGGYVGSFPGTTTAARGSLVLPLNATDSENVLTVVMDHSGHDQRAEAILPRGILGASLVSETNTSFSSWKVAGNAGGQANIDPVRGTIAEGGLHAERVGWHLPGFDDSNWASGSPSEGVNNATIGFFRTISKLDLAEGYDGALALVLDSPEGSVLRAQLYVNGYQYGKFVPHVGNQITFPVPPGIVNLRGDNTIGLNIWSQTAEGAKVDVKWKVLGVYESAFDTNFDASYLQPGWSEERLKYV